MRRSRSTRGGGAWTWLPPLVLLLLATSLFLRGAVPAFRSGVSALSAALVRAEPLTLAAARAAASAACAADAARAAAGRAPQCLGSGSGSISGGISVPASAPAAPPLQLYYRVAAVEKSFSGGARFQGWRKSALVLATTASLRAALDALASGENGGALRPPPVVNITVLYDGLQRDAARAAAWRAAIEAVLAGDWRWAATTALVLHHAAVSGDGSPPVGNRGTNLVQFARFRELPCARAAADGGGGGGGGDDRDDDPLVYFVEDDYIHMPSALSEMVEVLTLPWIDGSPRARFATPMDHPDRLRSMGDLARGATLVVGGSRHVWRSVPSTTMTFASRCADAARVLPTMEALAPDDFTIWPRLQWRRFAGLTLATLPENQLFGPMPSLAIHGTSNYISIYGPAGTGFASWCGFADCLRDAALAVLAARAPAALEVIRRYDTALAGASSA